MTTEIKWSIRYPICGYQLEGCIDVYADPLTTIEDLLSKVTDKDIENTELFEGGELPAHIYFREWHDKTSFKVFDDKIDDYVEFHWESDSKTGGEKYVPWPQEPLADGTVSHFQK